MPLYRIPSRDYNDPQITEWTLASPTEEVEEIEPEFQENILTVVPEDALGMMVSMLNDADLLTLSHTSTQWKEIIENNLGGRFQAAKLNLFAKKIANTVRKHLDLDSAWMMEGRKVLGLTRGKELFVRALQCMEEEGSLTDEQSGQVLWNAVKRGDCEAVRLWLMLGPRPALNWLATCLDETISLDDLNMAQILLQSGLIPPDRLLCSLGKCAEQRRELIAKLILATGVQLNDQPGRWLWDAVQRKDSGAVCFWLDLGLIDDDWMGICLNQTILENDVERAELLLQSGRVIPARLGFSLEKTAEHGREFIARLILATGEQISPHYVGSALHKAVQRRDLGMVQLLLNCNQKIASFWKEMAFKEGKGDTEIVSLFMNATASAS